MEPARTLLALRKFYARASLHADRAIRYTACGLLVLGVVLAAWQLWTTLRGPAEAVDSMSRRAAVVVSDTVSEDNIAAMHLFGTELPAAPRVATSIDVLVAGIAYSSQAGLSRAILVVNGTARSYAVDAMLPDGARIVSIEQTRVVLDQNGERYALVLEHGLADRNADFGSLWAPAATVSLGYPGFQAVTAEAGGTDKAMGLEIRRQNLAVPSDALRGKQGQGVRVRAMHRGRIPPKPD